MLGRRREAKRREEKRREEKRDEEKRREETRRDETEKKKRKRGDETRRNFGCVSCRYHPIVEMPISGTFAESSGPVSNYIIVGEDSRFAAYGSVFRDGTTVSSNACFAVESGRASLVDCLVSGNVVTAGNGGAIVIGGSSVVSVLRTTFRNNRAATQNGCFGVAVGSQLTIEDSDIEYCWAGGKYGMLSTDDIVTITNSRMVGNGAAGRGGLASLLSSNAFLRITDSTISNTNSGVGEFAIDVADAVSDFSLQLDTVVVDRSVNILSNRKVLVQNCKGFNSTAVQNASVGTCQSTADYCLAESCADDRDVGTDCICEIDGVPNPFPTDCMQSAIIEARLSTANSLILAACDVFWLPHSGPGTVDTYSHVYHPETSQQNGGVSTIERACILTVSA